MRHRLLAMRRWLAQKRRCGAPLDALLRQPLQPPTTSFRDAEIVSLDIETTGLDPASAEMLSVGWVIVRNGKVDLSSARSYLVRPRGGVGDSASIHGLTDTVVGEGHDVFETTSRPLSDLDHDTLNPGAEALAQLQRDMR